MCRILREPSSLQSPPAQLAVCCWSDLSVGGSSPNRARTRRSGYRSLVCTQSSFGRSRRSRRFSSGRPSSPLRLWFGRRKRQRPVFRLDLFWKCHSFGRRIRRVLRSSLQELRKRKGDKSLIPKYTNWYCSDFPTIIHIWFSAANGKMSEDVRDKIRHVHKVRRSTTTKRPGSNIVLQTRRTRLCGKREVRDAGCGVRKMRGAGCEWTNIKYEY